MMTAGFDDGYDDDDADNNDDDVNAHISKKYTVNFTLYTNVHDKWKPWLIV